MLSTRSASASKSACIAIASTSVAAITLWRVLQWRARRRARLVAERAQKMVQDGHMINVMDETVTTRLVEIASKRASKWLSYQRIDAATPMIGQVGGLSFNKRPVLTLPPDYVLKPLHTDHRGFREIAFYEAVKVASLHGRGARGGTGSSRSLANGNANAASSSAMTPYVGTGDATSVKGPIEKCDALAMTLAMFLHDAIVAQSEHTVISSWKALRKEIELLKRLSSLTASYYGVVAQNLSPSNPNEVPTTVRPTSEITSKSYLLLSDLTANFSKPCALDIKIGQQSYEPTASEEKKQREIAKHPQQAEHGFRIVGVRVYDPSHPDCDLRGFRQFDKHFGRGLTTKELVKEALLMFFTSYCHTEEIAAANKKIRRTNSIHSLSSLSATDTVAVEPKTSILRARAISKIVQQLRVFQKWFQENKCLAFYSSSILMVFEGDPNTGNKDLTDVKMIDFGHVVRQAGGDPGYLYGLKQLSNMLAEILEEADER